MGSRGVLFALTPGESKKLLAATDDDEVMEVIEELEERWDTANLAETDKAWEAIHRALTDGQLDWDNGQPPLNQVILGGRRLYDGDDYIAVFKPADAVVDIHAALEPITPEVLTDRYRTIVPPNYAPEYGDEDLEYTVGWFEGVKALYQTAASTGRNVLFTADQ